MSEQPDLIYRLIIKLGEMKEYKLYFPSNITALAVATNERPWTVTSSPPPVPAAFNAKNNDTVPLLFGSVHFTARYFCIS